MRRNNTALLRLVLPAALSVAGSSSGTYGAVITPVPESQEYALMLAGLALMSLVVRRRNWHEAGRRGWRFTPRGVEPTERADPEQQLIVVGGLGRRGTVT